MPCRALHGRLHALAQLRRKCGQLADEAQAHAVAVQLVDLTIERLQEQLHQSADLGLGALPVLRGEGEQGEGGDALAQAELHGAAYRLLTGAVAEHAGTQALLRPAAVAVHDDGDVGRHARSAAARGRSGRIGGAVFGGVPRCAQSAISSSSLAFTTTSTS